MCVFTVIRNANMSIELKRETSQSYCGKHTLNNTTLINTTVGNANEILRHHYADLSRKISEGSVLDVIGELYSNKLIQRRARNDVLKIKLCVNDHHTAMELLCAVEEEMESSLTPSNYFKNFCDVLINQKHKPLTDIAIDMLHKFGK